MFFWQNSMLHAGKGNLTSPEIVNTMKQSRKHNLAGGKKVNCNIQWFFSHPRADIFSHPSDSISVFYVFSMDFPAISSHIPPKGLHLLGTKDADHSLLGKSWGNDVGI